MNDEFNPMFKKFDEVLGKKTPTTSSTATPVRSRADEIRELANKSKPSPKVSTFDPNQSPDTFMGGIPKVVGDVATGFAKEGIKTVKGLTDLGEKFASQTAGRVVNAAQGKGFTPTETSSPLEEVVGKEKTEEITTPSNTAEKVGGVIENVAEFALPTSKLSMVGKVEKGVSFLQKTLGLVKKSLTEGAVGAGQTAVKEGEFDKDALDSGLIAAAFPVVGKGFQATKDVLVNPKNGARLINSLIKPLLKDLSYGKDPGKTIAELGITGKSLEDLAQNVSKERKNFGQAIKAKIEGAGDVSLDLNDTLDPIDQAMIQAKKNPRTNAGLIARLKDLKDDILGVVKNEKDEDVVTRNLSDVSAIDAFQFKQDIGDVTKFTGNASDDEVVNKAMKQVYGKIKEKLNKAIPGLDELNERYADLTSAEIATKYRDKIEQRQDYIKFGTRIGAVGTFITSLATMNPLPVIIGLGATGAEAVLSTPRAKTALAKWLSSASREQKEKVFQAAPWFKGLALKVSSDLLGQEDQK